MVVFSLFTSRMFIAFSILILITATAESRQIDASHLIANHTKYCAALAQFQGVLSFTKTISEAGNDVDHSESEIVIGGKSHFVALGKPDNFPKFIVNGCNPRYGFRLTCPPGDEKSTSGRFSLLQVTNLSTAPEIERAFFANAEVGCRKFLEPSFLHGVSWPELLESSGFFVSSSQPTQWKGMEASEATFKITIPEAEHRGKKIPMIADGKIVVSTSNAFPLIVHWEGNVDFNFAENESQSQWLTADYEYDSNIWHVPVLTCWTLRLGDQEVVSRYAYLLDRVPSERFYLSYYGLTEPVFAKPAYGRLVLAIVLGVAFLMIGLVIRRRTSMAKA